jgi:phosphotransferase system enzyme I (PtsI)
MAIVDGKAGAVLIDPDEDTLAKYKKLQADEIEKRKLLDAMKGLETVTKSGKHVHLYCNIGGVGDIGYVLENDGEGVGLFRSEFLYLQNDDYPTEEQQFQAYKQVAEILAGKQLIIRTLDIGADKQIDYFNLEKEENPALGFRAIRICLTREEIFMTQLKALLRASAYGNVAIMFPMIISKWEVERSLKLLEAAKADLRAHDVPFNENISVGIMIETPAAVFMADELAELVDFFSIGTNDLTQYTCAIDRQNQHLEKFFDAHHPAVLKAIQMTIDAGHRHNTWVGICGELGADPELTEVFVNMGIDELSMSPTSILRTRKIIRDMD